MIDFVLFLDSKGKARQASVSDLNEKGVFWVNLVRPSEDDFYNLKDVFSLHHLAIEDSIIKNQRPKIEDYPGHLFVIMHAISINKAKISLSEVDFFLGKNFLISVQNEPMQMFSDSKNKILQNPDILGKGPDRLLHHLVDRIVDDYFPQLDIFEDMIDDLEDRVFKKYSQDILNDAFQAKRAIITLRKNISYQREILNNLSGRQSPYVSENTALYFRDVYDHSIRLSDNIDTYRDLASGILEAYLNVNSNRLNETMKILTVITTTIMPLTLITGIYGMNFRFLPELEWQYGYYATLALMAVVGIGMLFFFKRKGWF